MMSVLVALTSAFGTYLGYRLGLKIGHYRGVMDEIERCERRNGIR